MDYSLQYYDLVLVCIAASLATGGLVGLYTPVAFEIAVPVLGVVALGFIGHALFINGPVDEVEELSEEIALEDVPDVLSPLEGASD